MKIVGHRGAAGLSPENTLESISRAMELGVDWLEVDFHLTADGKLVAHHDNNLVRMTSSKGQISDLTLSQIQGEYLARGLHIPSLDEVLAMTGAYPVYIELKSDGSSQELLAALRRHPSVKTLIVTSFNLRELLRLQRLAPAIRLHAASHYRPFHALRFAERHQLHGVTLHHRALTPLAYKLALERGKNLMVYSGVKNFLTIDSPKRLRRLMTRYPEVDICTNRPDLAIEVRRGLRPG